MKTQFEHIYNIINKKDDCQLVVGEDFVPYMVQRWISMISPEMAFVMNETSNAISPAMQDKQMWLDYFLTVVPKIGYKKISYLKKPKSAPNQDVSDLASLLQISCREAKEMIELDPKLKKQPKTVEVLKKQAK
jgi:hypothetical protein